jgi:hypothetical protein
VNRQSRLDRLEAPNSSFSCRAAVLIFRLDANEIPLVETTVCLAVRCQRFWDECPDSLLLAAKNFIALLVAAIGKHRQFLFADSVPRHLRHSCQLGSVMSEVDDVMRNDHVTLEVYSGLYVVANHSRAAPTGCH